MFGLFGRAPTPQRVPSDEVIPAFVLFGHEVNNTMPKLTLQFDAVLDAEMLKSSLASLLATGDWRKLGGRLRRHDSKNWEFHIPKEFTAERPAFRYTHTQFPFPMGDHPLASRFPSATAQPSVTTSVLGDLFPDEGDATLQARLFTSDLPPIGLQITSFSDATLVAISWHHVMFDIMGMQSLVRNWVHVLHGRENHVEHFLDYREDPLQKMLVKSDEECEPYALQDYVLGSFGMLIFAIHFIIFLIWNSKTEHRAIYLPEKALTKLRAEAESSCGDNDKTTATTSFISDGDVITAWGTRLACLDSSSSGRPVTIFAIWDLRPRCPSFLASSPGAGVYMQNLSLNLSVFTDSRAASQEPLGRLARRVRAAVGAQTTEAQAVAQVRHTMAATAAGTGFSVAATSPRAKLVVFSSWAKARFLEVADFGPAVVVAAGDGSAGREGPPGLGKPVYCDGTLLKIPPMPLTFVPTGKDGMGNYWVQARLPPAVWRRIEVEVAKLRD